MRINENKKAVIISDDRFFRYMLMSRNRLKAKFYFSKKAFLVWT